MSTDHMIGQYDVLSRAIHDAQLAMSVSLGSTHSVREAIQAAISSLQKELAALDAEPPSSYNTPSFPSASAK